MIRRRSTDPIKVWVSSSKPDCELDHTIKTKAWFLFVESGHSYMNHRGRRGNSSQVPGALDPSPSYLLMLTGS
jgi:hypothetical protein